MSSAASSKVVISGTGLWTPEHSITNEELVTAYNGWAEKYNQDHFKQIEDGSLKAKPFSNEEFIEKASGIKQRYVYVKDGILDINRMRPNIPERPDDALSDQAEIALHAARQAMAAACKTASDIDAVIVSCAYTQRAYPAIAIEVQDALGIEGFGFDMLVACSAATFALHRGFEMVAAGTARCVLLINPELTSPQVNYCDRDSHFIFGDVATAAIVERRGTCTAPHSYDILGVKAQTHFSSNVRSNFGYVTYANDADPFGADKLFHQNGRRVFKDVCPLAENHIRSHIESLGFTTADIKRWWLHQANINMNMWIGNRLLGEEASLEKAPIVLDRYANTASAGSLIAFHLYHEDLVSGDPGLICSFGAGYSIGSLVIRKR
jgi:beta-ketodecanoyl-[acyl-carrier-protein] synthase